jgi:uncharacterized DUF497 family protein
VSFAFAQLAFLDRCRLILEDLEHSVDEKRYYCLGKVSGGILTVRFTYCSNKIRIFGDRYWRKGKKFMKKKIEYTDEPIGSVRVVSDFLPSPEELALKDETIKVTIALSKASVEFFKNEAKKYNTQYQKMIRRLLDEYATHQA